MPYQPSYTRRRRPRLTKQIHHIMKGEIMATDDLRLDGVSAAREVPVLLLLLQRLLRLFVLGELPADCAGLLWSKVKREVLLALLVFA